MSESSAESVFDPEMRLQLQKMIAANGTSDQTELLRQLKHSHKLQEDINTMLKAKHTARTEGGWSEEDLRTACSIQCFFLFTHYTDLFNKIFKDEIDLRILNHFLNVLRQIEDGDIDQHEGSFLVGQLLKELYVDSALKKADKLRAKAQAEAEGRDLPPVREPKKISWSQFKQNTA